MSRHLNAFTRPTISDSDLLLELFKFCDDAAEKFGTASKDNEIDLPPDLLYALPAPVIEDVITGRIRDKTDRTVLCEVDTNKFKARITLSADEASKASNGHVPRPRNPFIIFRQEHHPIIASQNPGIRNCEISKIAGDMWKADPDAQLPYQLKAKEEKRLFDLEYPDYKYCPRKPIDRKRRIAKTKPKSATRKTISRKTVIEPQPQQVWQDTSIPPEVHQYQPEKPYFLGLTQENIDSMLEGNYYKAVPDTYQPHATAEQTRQDHLENSYDMLASDTMFDTIASNIPDHSNYWLEDSSQLDMELLLENEANFGRYLL